MGLASCCAPRTCGTDPTKGASNENTPPSAAINQLADSIGIGNEAVHGLVEPDTTHRAMELG